MLADFVPWSCVEGRCAAAPSADEGFRGCALTLLLLLLVVDMLWLWW
jgi:hypothetical protein